MKQEIMILSASLASLIVGCSTHKQMGEQPKQLTEKSVDTTINPAKAGPPVVIYKTTKDYSRNVPVQLNEDGTKVISYPSVRDVRVGDGYAYPTVLDNGYLLDNRGISQNVAFLSYTYEEYAALPATPSGSELMEKVIDKHPLAEIHYCGNRFQYEDLVKELNEQIRSGKFTIRQQ